MKDSMWKKNMKKTILVTGGGGYIGSHCALQLLLEDFDVIVVDNFENCVKGSGGWPESLIRVQNITKKSLKFYDVDVCDRSSLMRVFEKVKIKKWN